MYQLSFEIIVLFTISPHSPGNINIGKWCAHDMPQYFVLADMSAGNKRLKSLKTGI
jgi:hypothetical protein